MPKEGTKVYAVAELLLASRGDWVSLPPAKPGVNAGATYQLMNFYGMNIECSGRGPKAKYRLRGEYFDSKYVSYLPEPSEART
jgi:hypothetical protein